MSRLVIDPVTRVGGGLRIEAVLEEGVVTDAWCAATTFRGLERILVGRDPRDAWLLAGRVCGSDNGVHALASVRAVERAVGARVPRNARLVRNLLAGSQFVVSHVMSFYGRHALDWVDLDAATRADPAATGELARSLGDSPKSHTLYFRTARERLDTALASGQPGIFADGPWGHPAYRLSPEADLMIAAHLLDSLEWRRSMARLATFLGGKSPHPQTFIVGGMALAPPWGGPARPPRREHPRPVVRSAPPAMSDRGLAALADLVARAKAFVDEMYLPDVLALAASYRDWTEVGTGLGDYLAFGDFPEEELDEPSLLLPRGRLSARDLARVHPVDQEGVGETVAATHDAADDPATLRHPFDGTTAPHYQGPPAPVRSLADVARYSWAKAPRYDDDPMEVGPLARMLVAYARAEGPAGAKVASALERFGLRPETLAGTLGRTVARAIEASIVADRLAGWLGSLAESLDGGDLAFADLSTWDPGRWPSEVAGWSLGESARGAVGHWLRIRDRTIAVYQVVDGNTWNASPRDGRGRRGALERALLHTEVRDPERPLELLRTIHSFDPCMACAVH